MNLSVVTLLLSVDCLICNLWYQSSLFIQVYLEQHSQSEIRCFLPLFYSKAPCPIRTLATMDLQSTWYFVPLLLVGRITPARAHRSGVGKPQSSFSARRTLTPNFINRVPIDYATFRKYPSTTGQHEQTAFRIGLICSLPFNKIQNCKKALQYPST